MIILPIVSDHTPSPAAFPLFYQDYSASTLINGAKPEFSYKCQNEKSHWELRYPQKDFVWAFLTDTDDGCIR